MIGDDFFSAGNDLKKFPFWLLRYITEYGALVKTEREEAKKDLDTGVFYLKQYLLGKEKRKKKNLDTGVFYLKQYLLGVSSTRAYVYPREDDWRRLFFCWKRSQEVPFLAAQIHNRVRSSCKGNRIKRKDFWKR
ncbi:hypothetical protein CDAR_590921 [Caerostris darwini]|uniref:Uncharacterized protein n=1 Tax=Caerostris darwini TaxID=1538125 RepID=A0AAV4SLS0_9ARAC|nr:hypothetical protein CDAR_590921 [Caerostris darwini]